MRTSFRFSVLAFLVLTIATHRAEAYHHFYVNNAGTPVPVKWQTFGNVFIADTDGPAGQNFTTLCTTATTTWNNVVDAQNVFGAPTTSGVNFTGANINTAWGSLTGDGKYELVYDADGAALTALGLDPASVNGYGPSRRRLVGAQGVIDDAFFVVTGTRANFDLLSTLIHELGHIQGLAHSSVGMHNSSSADTALDKITLNSVPTMHPFSLGTGNTSRRTPEADDLASIRELYPEAGAASRWASATGEVRRCGTNDPVAGANVRLVSTTTPTTVQISRFSSFDGNANGRYQMNYIPAGTYRVVVEPLGANDFTLNRFGNPPNTSADDFDFEYLSPSTVELVCTEEMPEVGAANIATITGTNGGTANSNDFRVGAPDLAFVVDDTGSMSEEIGGVRSILNATITALQAASVVRPFPLTAIVTFKDDVTKRIVSNNPANLRTVVDALFASGGGDCPESSNAALLVSGGMLRKNGVSLLFTDADTRADGPAGNAVTSFYRSKGVRLFTLLSGTCSGEITPTSVTETGLTGTAPMGNRSSNNEEFPPSPVNGFEPGVTTFSAISSNTGGFFVAIDGINFGDSTETSRYVNTGTNLSVSSVLPALALVTPTNVAQGTTLNVEMNGSNTNFISGKSSVSFVGGGIAVNSVVVNSPTLLTVNITLGSSAALGFRDATVTTDLGGGTTEDAKGIGVINVQTAPTTPTSMSVTPTQGARGQTIDVTINAAAVAFTDSSLVSLGTGVTVMTNQRINTTTMQARIQVALDAAIGYRRVSVATPGIATAVDNSPAGLFQVVAAAPIIPIIQSVTPNEVAAGQTATLSIVGVNTHFASGTTILTFSGTGVSLMSVTVLSPTTLTAVISAASSAALGFRDVTAITGGETAVILSGLRVTKNAAPTSTAVVSSLNPSIGSQSVTFTATVVSSSGGTPAPTGTVTFLDNATSIGTGTLNASGAATLSISSLAVGSHPITARYDGDTNYSTSTSAVLTQNVNIAGFAPPPAQLSITAGQSLVIPLTLFAAPGSNLAFTLGCSTLPANASCNFIPNPVTPAAPPTGTAIQLTFSTQAASRLVPGPRQVPGPLGLLGVCTVLAALLGAGLFTWQNSLRKRLAFVSLAAFTLALIMVGCSGGDGGSGSNLTGSVGTAKGPTTLFVTGTSGTTTVTTSVNVTVQ